MNRCMGRRLASGFLLLGLLAGVTPSFASVAPTEILSGIPHQALFAIAFDGRYGVAVGARAQIMSSSDGGANWAQEPTTEKLSLFGVALSGERRIAVGQMGLILLKEGEGAWTRVESGTQERLMSVSLNSRGNAVIVGSFGTVLASKDGGRTWRKSSPDWASYFAANAAELGDGFSPHLYAVKVDENNRTTVVGEVGLILRSDDCGDAWRVLHRGDLPGGSGRAELFGLDLLPDGRGYAVGQRGLVFRTADGGLNWTPVNVSSTANLLGVALAINGDVTITAMREVLTSRDDGLSWQKLNALDVRTGWYSGAAIAEAGGKPFAVGHSGRIIRFAH